MVRLVFLNLMLSFLWVLIYDGLNKISGKFGVIWILFDASI